MIDEEDDDFITKLCKGPCKKELPANSSFFHKNGKSSDGLTNKCKDCVNKENVTRSCTSGGVDLILSYYPWLSRNDIWEYQGRTIRISHGTMSGTYVRHSIIAYPMYGTKKPININPKKLLEEGKKIGNVNSKGEVIYG